MWLLGLLLGGSVIVSIIFLIGSVVVMAGSLGSGSAFSVDAECSAFRVLMSVSGVGSLCGLSVRARRGALERVVDSVIFGSELNGLSGVVDWVVSASDSDSVAGVLASSSDGVSDVVSFFVGVAVGDSVVVARGAVCSLLWGWLPEYESVGVFRSLGLLRSDVLLALRVCELLVPGLLSLGVRYGVSDDSSVLAAVVDSQVRRPDIPGAPDRVGDYVGDYCQVLVDGVGAFPHFLAAVGSASVSAVEVSDGDFGYEVVEDDDDEISAVAGRMDSYVGESGDSVSDAFYGRSGALYGGVSRSGSAFPSEVVDEALPDLGDFR